MAKERLCSNWPLRLKAGTVVSYKGHRAIVCATEISKVPLGHVPIHYEKTPDKQLNVYADDIGSWKAAKENWESD